MKSSFKDSCLSISKKIAKEYDLSLVDSLIWIYSNIFYFKTVDKKDKYDLEDCKSVINISRSSSADIKLYEHIRNEEYIVLYEKILKPYTFIEGDSLTNYVSLKDMEEVYELFIQEEVRNKTGSFYTPLPIVEFITHNSIVEYIKVQLNNSCLQLEEFLTNKGALLHIEDVMKIIDLLRGIRIIDIACGGGVFLREAYKQLLNKLIICYQYLGISYDIEELKVSILSKNIHGIDIQRTSVEICKLLLLMGVEKDVKLNIRTGNALDFDFDIKYDIVLGNPPYIGEKGNKEIFNEIRLKSFGKKYYEKGMDYFYFFIYKSYDLLKDEGVLGYITTNYFVTADSGKKLRNFLKDNFKFSWIINFDEINIFQRAKGQHNLIHIANKSKIPRSVNLISLQNDNFELTNLGLQIKNILETKDERVFKVLDNNDIYTNRGHILIQCDNKLELLNKIEGSSNYILGDLCNVNQGIVSGADRVTKGNSSNDMDIGKGIFVLTKEELEQLSLLEDKYLKFIKPFYKNSQIRRYSTVEKDDLFILYIDDYNLNEEENPSILAHLRRFRCILEERREVKNGTRKWYALQWPRNRTIFEEEKIVSPQRSLENSFAYSKDSLYASADIYYITKKYNSVSLLYVLGLLNSSLMYYYLFNRGKRKGKYLELYATPLKSLPIVYAKDTSKIQKLEKYVTIVLNAKFDETLKGEMESKIDSLVFDLYNIAPKDREEILRFKKKN